MASKYGSDNRYETENRKNYGDPNANATNYCEDNDNPNQQMPTQLQNPNQPSNTNGAPANTSYNNDYGWCQDLLGKEKKGIPRSEFDNRRQVFDETSSTYHNTRDRQNSSSGGYNVTAEFDPIPKNASHECKTSANNLNDKPSEFGSSPQIPSRECKPSSSQSGTTQFQSYESYNRPEFVFVTQDLWKKIKNNDKYCTFPFYATNTGSGVARDIKPTSSSWNWNDQNFIQLPFSSENKHSQGKQTLKWETIQTKLTELVSFCENPDKSFVQKNIGKRLQDCIKAYCNYEIRTECNFENILDEDRELSKSLVDVLPFISSEALKLPTRLRSPVPVLKKGECQTMFLSRGLASSLLANGFLCTFPVQKNKNLPTFNFSHLLSKGQRSAKSSVKREKLKCVLAYFEELKKGNKDRAFMDSIISYERRYVPTAKSPNWFKEEAALCDMKVVRGECIEDTKDMLQVDFANKSIGGGVLHEGAVQEEIRFIISPELICSRLFMERMGDEEVIVVTGTRQFSDYQGYASSFKFKSFDLANVDKDNIGRERTQVVAMDALHFQDWDTRKQYEKLNIDRELHKSYVGFISGAHKTPIATGNWGCGAFNGDPELKFLIQWMSASVNKRPGVHYHVTDEKQSRSFIDMCKLLGNPQNIIATKKLYSIIIGYDKFLNSRKHGQKPVSVFEYVTYEIIHKQSKSKGGK